MRAGRGDVGVDGLRPGLANVRHVFEGVRAPVGPRGASEVVERDRVHARGGKALGKLLVEGVESADIGIDDDSGVAVIGPCEIPAETRPIRTDEHRVLAGRAAGDWSKKLGR